MVERMKDLCLDVDDDCVEKREMLARDITEVRSDKNWSDDKIIFCRLWIFVTTQNITAHWCTELYKPYQTITNIITKPHLIIISKHMSYETDLPDYALI
jgi:hypothetical protein